MFHTHIHSRNYFIVQYVWNATLAAFINCQKLFFSVLFSRVICNFQQNDQMVLKTKQVAVALQTPDNGIWNVSPQFP